MARISSPRAAFSILITSAPKSARIRVQTGPAMKWVKSITRTPSKANLAASGRGWCGGSSKRAVMTVLRWRAEWEAGLLRERAESVLLPGRLVLHRDRLTERDPPRTVEADEPGAAEWQVIVRRCINADTFAQHSDRRAPQTGRLLHDIIAGQITAAPFEDMGRQLSRDVAAHGRQILGILVRQVLFHELEERLDVLVVYRLWIRGILVNGKADNPLGVIEPDSPQHVFHGRIAGANKLERLPLQFGRF